MLKSVVEFEALVVDVLTTIISGKNILDLNSSHKTSDIMEALNFCVENHFVIGYVTTRMASGDVVADKTQQAFITYEGLKFIEAFNGEETSVIAKNALFKAKSANKISIIAIISALIAFFSNIDRIWSNFTSLVNTLTELIKQIV